MWEVSSGAGYKCENKRRETYMEFYVDEHLMFTGMGRMHPFGGNLSVWERSKWTSTIFKTKIVLDNIVLVCYVE